MRAALLIAGKDLRQRLRDRSALLVAIVVPLVLASIFGLIFHDVIGGKRDLQVRARRPGPRPGGAGVRAAGAPPARAQRPDRACGASRAWPPAATRPTAARSRRRSCCRPGFTAAIARAPRDDCACSATSTRRSARRSRESIAQSYAGRSRHARDRGRALHGRRASQRAARWPARDAPITLADVSTRSRQLDAGTFYAAGMAVFFLFFTVQFGISSILDERRDGTLARMLVGADPAQRRAGRQAADEPRRSAW